jgi:isochorismate hydrolase
MTAPGREVPIDPAHAALLIIDIQNYCTRPKAREIPSVQRNGRRTAEYPRTATRLSE